MSDFSYIDELRNGQGLVPNYADQQLRRDEQRAQLDLMNQQTRGLAAGQVEKLRQAARTQQFETELGALGATPNSRGVGTLMTRYPEFSENLKRGFDTLSAADKQQQLTGLGQIDYLIASGKTTEAIAFAKQRRDADRAAGQPTDDDDLIIAAVEDKDPAVQNGAKGLIRFSMASLAGPEKFAETLGKLDPREKDFTLGAGDIRYNSDGSIKAQSPYKPELIRGPNDEVIEYTRGGGDPASSGGAFTGGFENFYSGFLKGVEGGFVANDGGSGAPANFGVNQKSNPDVDVKNLTPAQGEAIMRNRYWKPSGADKLSGPIQAIHADTAVNMGVGKAKELLARSKNDPQQYMALREQHYRKLGGPNLPGWLSRQEKLASFTGLGGQGGGSSVRVLSEGKAPPQPLTPQQLSSLGLDPTKVYFPNENGVPTLVGGQDKPPPVALPKVPATTIKAFIDNRTSLKSIDRAVAAVKAYPNAVGFVVGNTPNFISQRTDPDGVEARAAIADIGSLLIHDRSGAAVTISETPRLLPFVPQVSDDPATIQKKLTNLRAALASTNQDMLDAYSNESGESALDRIGRQGAQGKPATGWGKAVRVK